MSDVLLLGMGGSTLCPEVLKMTFGQQPGFPELHVLDSTDPAQVKAFEDRIDPAKTLFVVSSKSGSTLEPNIFNSTSSSAPPPGSDGRRRRAGSSPSPIPGRSCSRRRRWTGSGACSPAGRTSAGAIPRCRISASCPPP